MVHFAAESHVDRSILEPADFIRTNVLGTRCCSRPPARAEVRRFVQVSTDEVYGSIADRAPSARTDPLSPTSPYSASKAGGDLLVLAYHRTFGLPTPSSPAARTTTARTSSPRS